MRRLRYLLILLPALALLTQFQADSQELQIVDGARSCLGNLYDSQLYPGGPPPKGRGACTDVAYYACLPFVDLQEAVDRDWREHPEVYGQGRNRDIDYRWCPTLIRWFRRHAQSLPTEVSPSTIATFRPGDIIFYDDGFGETGHVGVVSNRWSWSGLPLLIHNPGPICVEENALASNRIVGHFRLVRRPGRG